MALAGRLDAQNDLLARILDRLPERPEKADDGTVELREPAVAPPERDIEAKPAPPSKAGASRRTRKTTPKGASPSKETS